jgi:hypothetical protein
MNFQAYTLSAHPEWACIQVKAPESETRTPVHLCCVIDTSGSMESENKLENVKRSLQFLLDFLGPQDSISIITFSDTAKTILSQTFVNMTEKDNILTRISIIRVDSNTNISAGIIQAQDSLQIDTTNSKQGILLLTDGIANMGLVKSQDIIELVHNTISKFNGTSISSVGYGTDHNADLLQNISAEGGGSYYVVNNLEDVATVFGDILGGLVTCTSQQVRVILPIGTEVKSRYATNTIDDRLEIVIGDLIAGAEAAFLAKIPNGTVTTLKGYDLMTHNTYEINTIINTVEDATLQVNGEAHYIRFDVLELLEQSRRFMTYFSNPGDMTAHIEKINACITMITEYRRASEHSLWDILIDELNTCKNLLENRHHMAVDTSQIMTQHVGFLGRMRGLAATVSATTSATVSATTSQLPSMGDPGDDVPHLGAPSLGRTFSNHAQRQISSQLCATVSGLSYGIARQQAVDPTLGPSYTQDPSSVCYASPSMLGLGPSNSLHPSFSNNLAPSFGPSSLAPYTFSSNRFGPNALAPTSIAPISINPINLSHNRFATTISASPPGIRSPNKAHSSSSTRSPSLTRSPLHSAIGTPTQGMSPLLRPMTNMVPIPEIPPMPTGHLFRQVACGGISRSSSSNTD